MPFESLSGRAFYRCSHWTTFYAFTFGWSLRVQGREHLPRTGPYLLVSNHQSFIDPILVGAGATRALTYLARNNLWKNPKLAYLINWWGAVPIDRGFGKEGLQTVKGELDKGKAVLMFPEGERTHTGEVQPLKPGVALLIKRITCPIIPVGISGPYQAWPRTAKLPKLDPLVCSSRGRSFSVVFGPPIDPASYAGLDREAIVADIEGSMRKVFDVANRIRRKAGT